MKLVLNKDTAITESALKGAEQVWMEKEYVLFRPAWHLYVRFPEPERADIVFYWRDKAECETMFNGVVALLKIQQEVIS